MTYCIKTQNDYVIISFRGGGKKKKKKRFLALKLWKNNPSCVSKVEVQRIFKVGSIRLILTSY